MTLRVLFVFIVLANAWRRIVHFKVTEHPTARSTAHQISEAFPWEAAPRYLLRDRDRVYALAFRGLLGLAIWFSGRTRPARVPRPG